MQKKKYKGNKNKRGKESSNEKTNSENSKNRNKRKNHFIDKKKNSISSDLSSKRSQSSIDYKEKLKLENKSQKSSLNSEQDSKSIIDEIKNTEFNIRKFKTSININKNEPGSNENNGKEFEERKEENITIHEKKIKIIKTTFEKIFPNKKFKMDEINKKDNKKYLRDI